MWGQMQMSASSGNPDRSFSNTRRGQKSGLEPDRRQVLLVEDNPADARLVEVYLRGQPFDVDHAPSFAHANQLLASGIRYDVVLVDLRLPDSTPTSSVERIRGATPDLPIVVLSNLDDADTVRRCLDAGAQDYLPKGDLDPHNLIRSLEYAIARTQAASSQRQLERAEQHAVVGRIAAGVAHEVNNIATVMLSLGERAGELVAQLSAHVDDDGQPLVAELAGVIDEKSDGLRHTSEILRELQLVARPADDEETEVADAGDVVARTVRLVEARLRQTARLVVRRRPTPLVGISPRKLGQIVLNMLNNALDAIEGPVDDNEIRLAVGPAAGGASLEISDTGAGMASAVAARVFEPFFTTKGPGEGTGLGLAICRDLIEDVGGTLELDSAPGRGTTIRMWLPHAAVEAAGASTPPKTPTAVADNENATAPRRARRYRVLVVDDDRRVRTVLARRLSQHHDVVEADGGAAAIALLAADGSFDAVLCDLMMPDVDGIAVCNEIEARYPSLLPHVAVMSGGAYTTRAREFLDRTEVTVLAKPFALDNLDAFVDDLARR